MTARLSVVIPAHNEAAVIGRVLSGITGIERRNEIEIVVAANGCSDETASVARAFGVKVLELSTPSKVAALNAADAAATVFPRAYVDADVEVDGDTLLALADVLDQPDGPLVATPPMRIDASRSSWAVRAHYRVWELSEFRLRGHVGSGIYAMSADGRSRFGDFPDVIADDRFVQQLFRPQERGTTADGHFTVHAPRHLRALIRRSVRAATGNAQLRETGLDGAPAGAVPAGTGISRLARRVVRRPTLWPAFTVYCTSYLVPRLLAQHRVARGQFRIWDRDETSRQ